MREDPDEGNWRVTQRITTALQGRQKAKEGDSPGRGANGTKAQGMEEKLGRTDLGFVILDFSEQERCELKLEGKRGEL